jgi:hypothetical protein
VSETNFLASIQERDIDLLLLEEFTVNREFIDWFAVRILGEPVQGELIGAWHSVTHEFGETDLQVLFGAASGERLAFLIENKIAATAQPEQGARYQQRGESGVKKGDWDSYLSCLIAPAKYLSSAAQTEKYDVEISYEELMAFFSSRQERDARFSYRATVLLHAVQKIRRGYQPEYDENMTAFVEDYYQYLNPRLANLGMQEPKPRPKNSDWITFVPQGLPPQLSLCHQLYAGKVKCMFPGEAERLTEFTDRFGAVLDDSMVIETAGKSAAIVMTVPKIDPENEKFETVRENVTKAIQAVEALAKIVTIK